MRQLTPVTFALALVVALAATPALAQSSHSRFDLQPGLTQAAFEELTTELGSVLRFPQLGDVAPLGKGHVDIGVHYARTIADDSTTRSNQFPRIVARVGVSDRVDIGAWGGFDRDADYGFGGVDARIALMTQGPSRPVSVAIRPSLTSLVGPSEMWVGNASVDLSVSRTFGAWSPYVGVSGSSVVGMERSTDVDLEYATTETSTSYAGVAYRWRALVLAAEAENGVKNNYAFRVSTRF
jgi:hypothetical protein